MLKKPFMRGALVVATMAALTLLASCDPPPPVDLPPVDPGTGNSIPAPTLTMSLPASLTNATPPPNNYTSGHTSLINATSHDLCNFGSEAEPFENGYNMTKFLVAISQGQSCFADFLIGIITTDGLPWVNAGKLPTGSTTAGDVTFIEITQSTDLATYSIWLYFDVDGITPELYLTWTTAISGDVTGQMIWVLSSNLTSVTEPDAVRVDFSRTASSATNQIYIRFPSSNPSVDGFRVDVTASGSGTSATYEAKGLVSFTEQWNADSLPTTEAFTPPLLAMVTVSDNSGLGASIADFQDLALHIANIDTTTPANDWSLGSYQFTVTDKAYFTALGDQEWQNKGVTAANYVDNNTVGDNLRTEATAGTLNIVYACLESATPCGTSPDEWGGWDLGAGYFTTTCTDLDGADCTNFVQKLYDQGWWGATPNSPAVDEPSGDSRQTDLAAATWLTIGELWPTGTTSTTAFNIP